MNRARPVVLKIAKYGARSLAMTRVPSVLRQESPRPESPGGMDDVPAAQTGVSRSTKEAP
jgi:hypothetical protein